MEDAQHGKISCKLNYNASELPLFPPHVISEKTETKACFTFSEKHMKLCFLVTTRGRSLPWSTIYQSKYHTPKAKVMRRMLWRALKEFRLHVQRERFSSVRNDDVNGALVGWWMCEELCSSRAQEVCFLPALQILPQPFDIMSPTAACSTLARTPTLILPSGRSGNYLYLSKMVETWKPEQERFPQIWDATLTKHSCNS